MFFAHQVLVLFFNLSCYWLFEKFPILRFPDLSSFYHTKGNRSLNSQGDLTLIPHKLKANSYHLSWERRCIVSSHLTLWFLRGILTSIPSISSTSGLTTFIVTSPLVRVYLGWWPQLQPCPALPCPATLPLGRGGGGSKEYHKQWFSWEIFEEDQFLWRWQVHLRS